MTYHLASLRLRSIGERSARFGDLVMDFTAPAQDAGPAPADSVIWLRNGGGKSSLLSMFYALLLPRAADFMGRAVKRALTDYVDSGDTAHTVAVWHSPAEPGLVAAPPQVLVTGAVYEYADLRRPADAERAREHLSMLYYAFRAVPGVIGAQDLPFTDDDGRPRRRAAFLTALRELHAAHPQVDLVHTDRQWEWSQLLRERGLDPKVFDIQKKMNHVEGGAEDMFRFASAADFVDFLLDLTVSAEEVAQIAERLASISGLLAGKPARTAERDFCVDAAVALERLAQGEADARASASTLLTARSGAAELARRLRAGAATAQQRLAGLQQQREELTAAGTRADGEREAALALAGEHRRSAARLQVDAARAGLAGAEALARDAGDAVHAWQLARTLTEVDRLEADLADVRGLAEAERADGAPLRSAHDRLAGLLERRLLAAAGDLEHRAGQAREAAAAARARRDAALAAVASAERFRSAAGEELARAGAWLESLAADLAGAVEDGLLPAAVTDVEATPEACAGLVEQARAAVAAELAELATQREAIAGRHARRPRRRTELTSRLAELAVLRTRSDGERAAVRVELSRVAAEAEQLAGLDRVRDLAEATGQAPVDLWGDRELLRQRLADAVRSADTRIVRLEAQHLDDRRVLDEQARSGVLPSGLDVARVLGTLAAAGVEAETGWAHLRRVTPAEQLLSGLQLSTAVQRAGAGVVVPASRLAAARAVLAAEDVTTSTPVGLYTAEELAAAFSGGHGELLHRPEAAWTGMHPGLVDEAAAEAQAAAIGRRTRRHDDEVGAIVADREDDRALLGRLESFWQACPAGHQERLRHRLDGLDAALVEAERSEAEIRAELAGLAEEEADDAGCGARLAEQEAGLRRRADRLDGLASRSAAAAGRSAERDAARRRAEQARHDAARQATAAEEALLAAGEQARAALDRHDRADALRAEAARITFLDPRHAPAAGDPRDTGTTGSPSPAAGAGETGGDPAGAGSGAGVGTGVQDPPDGDDAATLTLEDLRERLRRAAHDHDVQVSGSVLAERERGLLERLATAREPLGAADPRLRDLAAHLLAGPGAGTETERLAATRAAAAERDAAQDRLGAARAVLERATADLARIAPAGAGAGRGRGRAGKAAAATDPVQAERDAAAAQAAAEDADRQAEQSRAAREEANRLLAALDHEGERLRQRLAQVDLLLDPLPTADDETPAGGGPLTEDGEVEAAWAQVLADDTRARAEQRAAVEAIASAQARLREAETTRGRCLADLRQIAARHATVSSPARDRVAHDPEGGLAAAAPELSRMLRLRAEVIDGELAGIAADQSIVTTALAHLVRSTLAQLRATERHSRLPEALGAWGGRHMLRIGFDEPESDSDLVARMEQVVEQRVSTGLHLEGMALLQAAVHAAVEPRGFSVKVLKPSHDLSAISEDITRLATWSGGEKLTVCVALYCTLAAQRAVNAGRAGRCGGVLMLDNPIGRASHTALVRLQREVAAAHGVQLIYTTGVKDLDAVAPFPAIVRLDNRPGRTMTRRFIVLDPIDPAAAEDDPAAAGPEVRQVVGTAVSHLDLDPAAP